MDALLCRDWKSRVKGRDWYDLIWYVTQGIPVRLVHLEARMRQSGDYGDAGPLSAAHLSTLLKDAAASLRVDQAQEEAAHAMRLVDFLLDRGGNVELQAIDRPVIDFDSPLSVMRAALAHEEKVTETINDLYAVAVQHNDYPAQVLMQWFVSEQVEEEKNAGEIVDQLELAAGSGSALLVLDGRLKERMPEEPTAEAQ